MAVEVNGGFGGRLGVVTGSGEMIATADYPELRITLTRGEATFPASCELRLEPAVPDDFDSKYRLCDAKQVKCPEKALSLLRRSAAVYCVEGGTSRLRNRPGLTCSQDTGLPTVWRTPPVPAHRPGDRRSRRSTQSQRRMEFRTESERPSSGSVILAC